MERTFKKLIISCSEMVETESLEIGRVKINSNGCPVKSRYWEANLLRAGSFKYGRRRAMAYIGQKMQSRIIYMSELLEGNFYSYIP